MKHEKLRRGTAHFHHIFHVLLSIFTSTNTNMTNSYQNCIKCNGKLYTQCQNGLKSDHEFKQHGNARSR